MPKADSAPKPEPRFFLGGGKEPPSRGCCSRHLILTMSFSHETCTSHADLKSDRPARRPGLKKVLAGLLCCALLHAPSPLFGAAPSNPDSYSLTLEWDASSNPDVVGYRVYYGVASGVYTNSVTAGNATSATISGLLAGVTYYFAVTDFDADGLESAFSNEISYLRQLPGAQMQIQVAAGGQFLLTVAGTAGHTYNIEATQDLKNWTVIGTGTADASGSLTFTDTHAANFSQRFYRAEDTQ